jgi:nitrous oxide reductase accessory protein NosL
MKFRQLLVGFLLVGVVGLGGYLAYRKFVLPSHQCEICGRAVHAAHSSQVVLEGGRRIDACCPRCAMHYELGMPGKVARLSVADSASGQEIDARSAVYIEGSDQNLCMSMSETAPREPGVEYDLKFDRCLPSLIAFKDDTAAREFQSQHGGRLLSFAQALESVKHR